MNRLITNMIIGVTEGYVKNWSWLVRVIELNHRVKEYVVSAGYSHPVEFNPPAGVTVVCESDTVMVVTGSR
jgi:large subunit ribosomal protein L6